MLNVTIKTLESQNHAFECDDDITVRGFKEFIAETVSVSADSQRLIYCGRVLQDDKKLNEYGVNGKVIHMVQRAPPQPTSQSNNESQNQRRRNNGIFGSWPFGRHGGHIHRNAMYLGAVSVPTDVVEGLPPPQLSNTLSRSRLLRASIMLDRANRLMDRLDDPTVPLHPTVPSHPSADHSSAQELAQQTSAPEDSSDQDSSMETNAAEQIVQEVSDLVSAGIINVEVTNDDNDNSEDESVVNEDSINIVELGNEEEVNVNEDPLAEPIITDNSPTDGTSPNGSQTGNNQSNNERMPRPPQMATLLQKLITVQNRLQPYLERYQALMDADAAPSTAAGPDSVEQTQRIVDGVSECLHFLSHANHAMSDIMVDMAQQPPRNLRCRPIIIQHSAILQAGIPIQLESQLNIPGRNNSTINASYNNEDNEATRPSSPTAGGQDETANNRANNADSQQNRGTDAQAQFAQQAHQFSQSLLGNLLNLPSNVEVSMEISPPIAEIHTAAMDGSDLDHQMISDVIRDVIQNAYDRQNRMPTDGGGGGVGGGGNNQNNMPFVTVINHSPDNNTSAQNTQARSNIGTNPTTATQTRSSSRPHVLHSHPHPLGNFNPNMDFDPFLPCNSHHVRRRSQRQSSAPQSSQINNQNVSDNQEVNQAETRSTPRPNNQSQRNNTPNNIAAEILGDGGGGSFSDGIGIAMALGELFRDGPNAGSVRISFMGNNNSGVGGINLGPRPRSGDSGSLPSLRELLRLINSRFFQSNEGQHFVMDLWLFLLRTMTAEGLSQATSGQNRPFVALRRPLREFFERSFPNNQDTIQNAAVDRVMTLMQPHIQNIKVTQEEMSNPRVNFQKTVESVIRKFCERFMQMLYDDDIDDTTFAVESLASLRTLNDQFGSLLHYLFTGGRSARERIVTRIVNQITRNMQPVIQITMQLLVSPHIQALATTAQSPLSVSNTVELLVYNETVPQLASGSTFQPREEPKVKQAVAQAAPEAEPEPMETDADIASKVVEDPLNIEGEEIPETFPGHESVPRDWVPIIARDVVRQRRQIEIQTQNGGQLPYSDGYIGGMPSKRRKIIEQQKSPLLVSPAPNHSAIASSVERLVKEGISHSGVQDVEGAAAAVGADRGVRSSFGQAIRECLNPSKLNGPDFPNAKRFPNASKRFSPDQNTSPKNKKE